MVPLDPDRDLRLAAQTQARELNRRFQDVVPLAAIREGFVFDRERISFGSFQKGIHRARQQRGPAALTVTTAPIVAGKKRAYEDELDSDSRTILYHYRAGDIDQPDNRALRAAFELQAR